MTLTTEHRRWTAFVALVSVCATFALPRAAHTEPTRFLPWTDAPPPSVVLNDLAGRPTPVAEYRGRVVQDDGRDRKSTRLNSSHPSISYAVFCLKKKKKKTTHNKNLTIKNKQII